MRIWVLLIALFDLAVGLWDILSPSSNGILLSKPLFGIFMILVGIFFIIREWCEKQKRKKRTEEIRQVRARRRYPSAHF